MGKQQFRITANSNELAMNREDADGRGILRIWPEEINDFIAAVLQAREEVVTALTEKANHSYLIAGELQKEAKNHV